MACQLLVHPYPWERISPLVSARPCELTTRIVTQCKMFVLHTWDDRSSGVGDL
jgi:hypothetical protein